MHTSLSVALSSLFVLLGGLNIWLMLGTQGGSKRTVLAHRIVGYVFIAIYSVMLYYMILRIRGAVDELPARILVHMVLALLLIPLLAVKVVVARHQKGLHGVLRALGIAIFAISFTLVALNIVWHALRSASGERASPITSAAVLILIFAFLSTLLVRRPEAGSIRQTGVPTAVPIPAQIEDERTNSRPKVTADQDPRDIPLILSRVQPQTHDSKTLRFIIPQNRRWSVRPGQYLTFDWMIDGERVVRSYSICSSPTQTGYVEITPKRMPNGRVSVFLNDRALPGLVVTARGPYGQFCFDERKHKRIVLVAGGSGITPMMAMLRYVDDLCLPVEVTLIYCVRNLQDVFFEAELSDLESRSPNFRRILILSQPDAHWGGPRGYLTHEMIENNVENIATATVFLCGPPAFMENAHKIFTSLGVDPANIMQESFGGGKSSTTHVAPLKGSSFQIEFARSGKTCSTSSASTILETAEANGLRLPFSCRQGECGTCAARLLAGTVDMEREDGLETELKAQGYILLCVGRACSDIKVDA